MTELEARVAVATELSIVAMGPPIIVPEGKEVKENERVSEMMMGMEYKESKPNVTATFPGNKAIGPDGIPP